MLIVLPHVYSVMESDIYLSRAEVIKRYRGSCYYKRNLLQMLLMYPFCFVYKSDTGELSVV